jgi:hypothetical protein
VSPAAFRWEALAAEGQPEPERQQDSGGNEGESAAAGEQFDADDRASDDAGQRASD